MNNDEKTTGMIGLHQFTAYEGEITRDGAGQITNKVAYESPVYKNMIVNTGKTLTLQRLFSTLTGSISGITSVGVGTDSTAPSVSQTQLNPSVSGSVLIQTADAGTSISGQVVTITSTFGTGVANFNWNEAGLFNGNTNGTSTMFNRVVIGPFAKTSAVSIVYQTTVTQS